MLISGCTFKIFEIQKDFENWDFWMLLYTGYGWAFGKEYFKKKFLLLRWKFLSGFLVVSVFLGIFFDNGWEDVLPVQSS